MVKKLKALLIAEKPSLMEAVKAGYRIGKDIPYDIDFLAQSGHLLTLKTPSEIDKKKYSWNLKNLPFVCQFQYKPIDRKAYAKLKEIKEKINSGKYDLVIHAGDADQEGELLVRETLYYTGNALPVKRFWTNDLTEGAVIDALKDMKDDSEYDNLYNAALIRQHSDYDFGMNMTTVATLKYGGYKNVMNIGRVKAPIMRMLADREVEIRDFKPTTDYRKAFTYKGMEFVCDNPFETVEKATPKTIPDKALLTKVEYKDKKVKAPKLFKLSTLQAEAAKAFGFNGARTLSIAQSLYEKKVTTYPRTDCEYLFSTTDLKGIMFKVAKNIGLDTKLLKRGSDNIKKDKDYTNDALAAKEGHTAIIPTGRYAKLSPDEFKLYSLISRRFLAMFGEYKEVHMIHAEAIENKKNPDDVYVYAASNTIKRGYENILRPNEKEEKSVIIEGLKEGKTISPIEFKVKEHTTKAPSRFNDASLIIALDHPEIVLGDNDKQVEYKIGTPATRAPIIEQLIKSNFIIRNKDKSYGATEKTIKLVGELSDTPLFDIKMSGQLEVQLDKVRHGEASYKKVQKELSDVCRDTTLDIMKRDAVKIENVKPVAKNRPVNPEFKDNIVEVNVPFAVRNVAKKQGAFWNPDKKTWYFKGFSDEEVKKKATYIARVAKTSIKNILPKKEKVKETKEEDLGVEIG